MKTDWKLVGLNVVIALVLIGLLLLANPRPPLLW
jgi:hypothetical protein